jgi:hypothetical protein
MLKPILDIENLVLLMREPLLDLQSEESSAIPHLNPALVPALYRSVLAITSEMSGVTISEAVFIRATRRIRAELCGQCLYYLQMPLTSFAARFAAHHFWDGINQGYAFTFTFFAWPSDEEEGPTVMSGQIQRGPSSEPLRMSASWDLR